MTAAAAAVRNAWPEIVGRSRVRHAPVPQSKTRLLGSSMKVEKGARLGVRSAVLYLAPATESGRNVCPHATDECAAACLGHNSGLLSMSHLERSRAWKTALFFGSRPLFLALLGEDIERVRRAAAREGSVAAVRCDGSSDLGIGARVASEFPSVQFWDYSKNAARALRAAAGLYAPNYHVTFSRSGRNDDDVSRVLHAGGGVAVVFNVRPGSKRRAADPLPETYVDPITGRAFRVIDGDESDARFLDRRVFGIPSGVGYVVGLRFKAAADREGSRAAGGSFIVDVDARLHVGRAA